ncbi:hypothetical protein ACTTZI_004219 [Vibrio vulnificus]
MSGDEISRDKLADLIQRGGLRLINEDMQSVIESLERLKTNTNTFKDDLEATIKTLPIVISREIDDKLTESVDKLVDAAEISQEHVEELQRQNVELVRQNLQKVQIDFILAAKESISGLFEPQIEKMTSLVTRAEKIKGTSPIIVGGSAVFLILVGVVLGVVISSSMVKKDLRDAEFYNEALYKSQQYAIEKTMNADKKHDFESWFNKKFAQLIVENQK